jgi:RHS repeat-associated protein
MTTAQHGYVMVDPNDKGAWQKLELEVPIEENGYIYIYVANESMDNVDVYFDDVLARRNNCEGGEVQLIDAPLTSARDYYPFGLAMAGRSYSSEKYRFGYQGQFAELDEETGWNSFELRMWGAVIGRWIEIDPARQFMSPYLGKGNSPVNGIDPDGRDWFTNGTWTIFQRGQSELSANVSEQYGGGFMNIGADNMYKEKGFSGDYYIYEAEWFNNWMYDQGYEIKPVNVLEYYYDKTIPWATMDLQYTTLDGAENYQFVESWTYTKKDFRSETILIEDLNVINKNNGIPNIYKNNIGIRRVKYHDYHNVESFGEAIRHAKKLAQTHFYYSWDDMKKSSPELHKLLAPHANH